MAMAWVPSCSTEPWDSEDQRRASVVGWGEQEPERRGASKQAAQGHGTRPAKDGDRAPRLRGVSRQEPRT